MTATTASGRLSGRPRSLGRSYAKLLTGTTVSAIGDGMYITALPLLAATLSRDPLAVAAVSAAGQLPWLLFALPAGALVDRVDRRRLLWRVDGVRCVTVAALAVAVLLTSTSIPLLAVVAFALGTGQVLYDTASQVFVPALVSREQDRLERANSRLTLGMLMGQQLAGQSAGGVLFAVARSVPFLADALSFAASSALVASIPGRFEPATEPGTARRGVLTEIGEGIRWLWRHRLLRTLALMVGVMNLTLAGCLAVLVLFAQDVLGLGSTGYGLLLAGLAVGGAIGGVTSGALRRLLGAGRLLVAVVVTTGVMLLVAGLASSAWLVGGLVIVLGVPMVVWNVVTVSLRQAVVPDHTFGRINSIYKLFGMGSMPIGAVVGGWLGHEFGLRSPFLFAAGVVLILALVTAPVLVRGQIDQDGSLNG